MKRRSVRVLALAAGALALAVPAAATAQKPRKKKPRPTPTYYVALGDSLSIGWQPDASGQGRLTNEGYPNQLYTALRRRHRTLRLVKLGCPGETTASMLNGGGNCTYAAGSQLAQAVRFIRARRRAVRFVTIGIGANDALVCRATPTPACLAGVQTTVQANLPRILAQLKAAAGARPRIAGMNYYNPLLASWLTGPAGQEAARTSNESARLFNVLLGLLYGSAAISVADVETAFSTADFTLESGVPRNVAAICRYTYMCAPPPVGPDIHANRAGHTLIATAFRRALGS